MKTCTQCGELKPLDAYHKASSCKDGRRAYCKICYADRKRKHYEAHKAEALARMKKYEAANKEKVLAIKRKYNAKMVALGLSAARVRATKAKRPDHYRADVSVRRKKLRQATPPWADKAALRSVYKEALRLGLTVDHIVPVRGKNVSGLHVPWNLQLLTLSENSRKRNKTDHLHDHP